MKKIYTVAPGTDDERTVAIEQREDGLLRLVMDHGTEQAREVIVDAARVAGGGFSLLQGERSYDIDCVEREDIWTLLIRGQVFERQVLDQRKLRMAVASGRGVGGSSPDLCTPMAGRVIALLVEPGQAVEQGQGAIIVEAMKMENELKAHRNGVVGQIKVSPGDTVEVGQLLMTIEDQG